MSFTKLQQDIIDQGLCARCGICAGICPVHVITFNALNHPELNGACTECGLCLRCCPGGDVNFPELSKHLFGVEHDAHDLQGYTEKLLVAHPTNTQVRYAGASGGLVTGLLLYMLEKAEIDGALVVTMDPEKPYRTKGVIATTPEQILDAAQSKYCLTPSMEVLGQLRRQKGKFAVVALPCQIHGLRKLEEADRKLAGKIACILGLYCNCNLKPNGHIEAIQACNITLDEVARFDFRGGGWPGGFFVTRKDGSQIPLSPINIKNVMNVMFRLFGARRCYLCPDALAEYADLSFGDFWAFDYDDQLAKLERCTLVSQRTERGMALLRKAQNDGAITIHELPKERASKRILNMAQGKKNRAAIRTNLAKKQGKAVPDFHYAMKPPQLKGHVSDFLYRLFGLFRGPLSRKMMLKLLFSKIGITLDRINVIRKNTFAKFHDN